MKINIPTEQLEWFFGIHGRQLAKLFPEYQFEYDYTLNGNYDGVYCLDIGVDPKGQNAIGHVNSVISYVKIMYKRRICIPEPEGWAFDFHGRDLIKNFSEYEFSFNRNPFYGEYDGLYHLDSIHPTEDYSADKQIVSIRSQLEYEFLQKNRRMGLDGLAWWLNTKFKKVYAVSHEIVTDLLPLRKDIKYIPQGVDTEQFSPKQRRPNKKFTVGWAGTDRYVKRFPTLMRALGDLEDIDFKYCLYQHPSQRTWEEMPEFFNSLDAYINISTTEGSNRGVIEAMSCGVPVIATPVGEAYQSVLTGTTGLLLHLNGNAVQGVRDAVYLMREIINNDMKHNAREYVMQHYDWNKIKHLYKEMFEDLLSETSNN